MKKDSIVMVSLKSIVPDPHQPRTEFEPAALRRLEESIKKQGILVPLALETLPNGKYLLLDGERRYRAATALKFTEVPAIVYDKMDDQERIMTRFHLQEQHSNWSAFDKAKAIATIQAVSDMTTLEVAEMLGLSKKTVNDYLLLLSLSKRSITAANEHKLPYAYLAGVAEAIKSVDNASKRYALEDSLIERIKSGVIRTASEIDLFKIVIRNDEPKHIEKILNSPKMSGKEIMEFAGLAAAKQHRKIMYDIAILGSRLTNGITSKINSEMTDSDEASLLRLKEIIDNYLDTSGAALPGKNR